MFLRPYSRTAFAYNSCLAASRLMYLMAWRMSPSSSATMLRLRGKSGISATVVLLVVVGIVSYFSFFMQLKLYKNRGFPR